MFLSLLYKKMLYDNHLSGNTALRGPRPFQKAKEHIPTWSRQSRQTHKPIERIVPSLQEKIQIDSDSHYHSSGERPQRKLSKIEADIYPKVPISDDEEEDLKKEIELCLKDLSSTHRAAVLSKITVNTDAIDSDEESAPESTVTKANLPSIPQISAPGYDDNDNDKEKQDMSNQPYSHGNDKRNRPQSKLPPIPQISAPGYDDDDNNSSSNIFIPQISSPEYDEGKKVEHEPKKESVYESIFFTVRCSGCHKPLSGQAFTTAGNQWHAKCFKCQVCKQPLEHIAFYEKDGLPYCALDYHELFSPRCDYCKTPIEEHSISALGKSYHPGHFFCRECGKPFQEDSSFLEHDGHAYCEKDYYKKFGKKCKGCEEVITGDFLVALGGEWHKECFVCSDCGAAFSSRTFLIRNGKPYCEAHYDSISSVASQKKKKKEMPPLPKIFEKDIDNNVQVENKVCHNCHEPIIGRCSSAFGKDYHPLHFQCSECHKLLSVRVTGLYQEKEPGELICKSCARKSNKRAL
ncbi:unnamed protein product [Rhizopus microsporus]